MSSLRAFALSLALLPGLGCGSTDRSTKEDDAADGATDVTNATSSQTSSSTNPTSTTGTAGPSGNTGGGDGAATTGVGGSGGNTNSGPTTDGSGGGGGGGDGGVSSSSSSSGGAATTGTASSGTPSSGSGAGGTDSVVDPNCGSHKWACWPMPNQVGSGPNEASYTKNGDETVTDNITLLMWDDRITAQAFTWEEAIEFCDELELAGFDDWRLPTRIEIFSVLDHSDAHTGWAAEAFEAGNSGFHFSASDWILTITQTGAGAGNDYAWAFNMSDGIVSNAYSKSNHTAIKCVRGGGSGEGPSDPAVAPPDQYTLVSDDEVHDNYTRLTWQRGGSDEMLSWQEAVDYCNYLGLGGTAWRLPTIRELATLVDEAQVAPAINREMFPDTKYGARSNDWYWATPQRGSAAWGLNFDDGFTGTNTGSAEWNTFGPAWARCVRE